MWIIAPQVFTLLAVCVAGRSVQHVATGLSQRFVVGAAHSVVWMQTAAEEG